MHLYCKAFFAVLVFCEIKLIVASGHNIICKECPNPLEMVVSILASLILLTMMALLLACFHCCRLPHGRTLKEYRDTPCEPVCQTCPQPKPCVRRCGAPITRSVFLSQPTPYSRFCSSGQVGCG